MGTRVLKSMHEPVLQEFYKLARLREHRENRNQVIVCGTKMVRDLAAQGSVFQEILYPAGGDVPFDLKTSGEKYPVGVDSLRRVSLLHDFNGLIGKLNMPEGKLEDLPFPKLVACLDVKDIGHLGTLLRSALAFQWHGVWILRGSGDVFDPKTLRAALGAQFHLPFRVGSIKSLMSYCKKNNLTLTLPNRTLEEPVLSRPGHDRLETTMMSSSSSSFIMPSAAPNEAAANAWVTPELSKEEKARLLEAEIREFHRKNKEEGKDAAPTTHRPGGSQQSVPIRREKILRLGGEKGTGACVILSDQKSDIRWPRGTVELDVSNPRLDFPVFAATCLYEVKKRWFVDAPRSASVPSTKKR